MMWYQKFPSVLLFLWAFSVVFLIQEAEAFFTHHPHLEKTSDKIFLKGDSVSAEIVHTSIWKNISEESISPVFLRPWHQNFSDPILYIDSKGKNLETFTGQVSLEKIFDHARASETAEIFGLASPPYTHLLESAPIIIKPDQTVETKFRYQVSWDFLSDFYFTEIFLRDGYLSKNFEFVLSLQNTQDLHHFIPVFEHKPETYRENGVIVARWHFSPTQKFTDHAQIFFSKSLAPTLEYPTENENFIAQFYPEIPTKKFEKIFFLIDKSGKNYGERYTRIPKIIRAILKDFPEEKLVGGVFFDQDETVNFFEEAIFLENIPQTHEKILQQFSRTPAVGKGDWEGLKKAFEKMGNTENFSAENTAIVLIGSFDSGFFPANFEVNFPEGNFFFMNFEEIPQSGETVENIEGNAMPHNPLLHFIMQREIPWLKLFTSGDDFLEKKAFWKKWNAQKIPKKSDNFDFPKSTQDILPITTPALQDENYPRVFIGRDFSQTADFYTSQARFIPKLWTHLEAQKKITIPAKNNFYGKQNPDARFSNHIPFYPHPEFSHLFMQQDFESLDHPEKTVLIQPFSPAQKKLFLTFPDIFASLFAVDTFVAGCHKDHRCMVVDNRENFRKNFTSADLLWWRDFHNDHWANPYLKILAEKNVLNLSWDGNAEPDQKITRGAFVRMVVPYFYSESAWENFAQDQDKSSENIFQDLSPNDTLTDQVQFLVSQEVLQGFEDRTFRPHETLTRAQAVKILLAVKEVTGDRVKIPENLPFPDITGWEIPWVVEAHRRGMVQGFSDGKFWPHRALTKGQAAKLMVEMEWHKYYTDIHK
jgi:hypothetical protein